MKTITTASALLAAIIAGGPSLNDTVFVNQRDRDSIVLGSGKNPVKVAPAAFLSLLAQGKIAKSSEGDDFDLYTVRAASKRHAKVQRMMGVAA